MTVRSLVYAAALVPCAAVLLSWPGAPAATESEPSPGPDFADVARDVAPKVRDKVVARQAGQTFRVAVFPFGDADGKVTIEMQEACKILQGELIHHLMGAANGKFLVLDKAALQREFRKAGADPAGVGAGDPKATAAVLAKIGVDAAVLGSIDAKNTRQVFMDKLKRVNVSLTVAYKDGAFDQLTGSAGPGSIQPPRTQLSSRFLVQVLARTGSGDRWTELPLVTSKNYDSPYSKVMFAEVPASIPVGTDNARYAVRISNRGDPPVKFGNPKDRERLFGVAVSVDGVNSFYQKRPDGTTGPVVLAPKNARKWILTGPGQKLVPDPAVPKGYRLERAAGAGHSVLDVIGFQKDEGTADTFVFAPAKESVAEAVGITTDIGVITVHFFPEDLPGDVRSYAVVESDGIGTRPGPAVERPVFAVNPKFKPEPVESWRIFYRKAADIPIPASERTVLR